MTNSRREMLLTREIPNAITEVCGCGEPSSRCITATVLKDDVAAFSSIADALLRYVPGDWVEVPGGTAQQQVDPNRVGMAFFQAIADVHGCHLDPGDLLDECGATDTFCTNIGLDPAIREDCDKVITQIGNALARRVGVHIIEELPV